MHLTITAALLCILLVSGSSTAGEIREIELKYGSIIAGEVLSLTNGVYTIRSGSLGTITIDDAKVRAIRPRGQSPKQSDPFGQVRSLEETMRSDKKIMGMIESLKDDPQFQQVLDDPEIVRAVQSGDLTALLSNPKFLQLMQNRTVRDIQQKAAK